MKKIIFATILLIHAGLMWGATPAITSTTIRMLTPTVTPTIGANTNIITVKITRAKDDKKYIYPDIPQKLKDASFSYSVEYVFKSPLLALTAATKTEKIDYMLCKFHIKDRNEFLRLLNEYGLKEHEK